MSWTEIITVLDHITILAAFANLAATVWVIFGIGDLDDDIEDLQDDVDELNGD